LDLEDSAQQFAHFFIFIKQYFVTDQRGYSSIAHFVADEYLAQQPDLILFNSTVTKIDYQQGLVALLVRLHAGLADNDFSDTLVRFTHGFLCVVMAQNGPTLSAKYVITTFSAAVINNAFASNSLFSPPMPVKTVTAFDQVGFGTYMKIFFKFPYIFWVCQHDPICRPC
jgi:hypothetical protein